MFPDYLPKVVTHSSEQLWGLTLVQVGTVLHIFASTFSPLPFLGPRYQDLSLGVCSGCQQAYLVRQSPSGGAQEDLGAEGGYLTRMEQEGAQKGHLKEVLI